MNIDNNDKQWAEKTFNKIIESISLLIALTGCIVMVLQALNKIEYPHGLIAGGVCLGFGFIFFVVEKTAELIKLKITNKKGE